MEASIFFHFLLLSCGKYSAALENRKRLLYYKSIFEKFVLQKMQMCTRIVTSLAEMYIFWGDTWVSWSDYWNRFNEMGISLEISCWEKERHQLEGRLVSWESDFTRFEQLVTFIGREGSPSTDRSVVGRTTPWPEQLRCAYLRPSF